MARYTILLFFTYFGVMRIWNFLSRSSIPGLQQSPPSRNFTDNNFLLVEWHCQICHTFDWVLKTGAYFLIYLFFFPHHALKTYYTFQRKELSIREGYSSA